MKMILAFAWSNRVHKSRDSNLMVSRFFRWTFRIEPLHLKYLLNLLQNWNLPPSLKTVVFPEVYSQVQHNREIGRLNVLRSYCSKVCWYMYIYTYCSLINTICHWIRRKYCLKRDGKFVYHNDFIFNAPIQPTIPQWHIGVRWVELMHVVILYTNTHTHTRACIEILRKNLCICYTRDHPSLSCASFCTMCNSSYFAILKECN